jgi:outer membrane pore protein F
MMKRNILAVVIPALLVAGAANAAEIYNKNGNKLDFYGKMVGEHVWTTNGDTSSDDTTYARIGLKGETQINDQLTGYGQWEYNMDASNVEGSQPTKTRLAFAGLKAGEYGSFDYGRNYGAIYDVEAATDMLVEWGGDGWNYTDNFMTGRTNGVATYRNSDFFGLVDGLSFALQYQGKNDHDRAIRNRTATASAPRRPTRLTTVSRCLQATPAPTVASIRKLTAMATKLKHGQPPLNMTPTTSTLRSCTLRPTT